MYTRGRVNRSECQQCELPAQERLNYFTGQFLAERDFRAEQDYHIGKHRQHNRYLHGWGTVCGLKVVQHPDPACQDRFVVLEPGLALDCCGREIVVREKVYVDLQGVAAPAAAASVPPAASPRLVKAPSQSAETAAAAASRHLLISLCYRECKTEFVSALYSECGCDENVCEANRVHEGFEVKAQLVDNIPDLSQPAEAAGVDLSWEGTINQEKAWRLAVDQDHKLLYVLNSAKPSQVMVYEAESLTPARTINLKVEALDLALSPDGRYLYILCRPALFHKPKKTGDLQFLPQTHLRVLDLQNGDNLINDLPLGPLTGPLKVVVATADGKVVTMGAAKKIIVWNSTINNPPVQAKGRPARVGFPRFAEIDTDAQDIAVSPDGAWLFVAEKSGAGAVTAYRLNTLALSKDKWVTCPLTLPAPPQLLAVSGDSRVLYVTTAAPAIHAFVIQETPRAFPEIGAAVPVGPETPVALQASPEGRWAYLLLQDDKNKGWVRAVNGARMSACGAQALGRPVAVASGPVDLYLAAQGRRLFAAGAGAAGEGGVAGEGGAVSVLKVTESCCEDLLWRALDGCPTCPDEVCLPLAAVLHYTGGMAVTDQEIDNQVRPLAPSTETLKELILCALAHGSGQPGPPGPQGPTGPTGPQGDPGPGLDFELTKIEALSWIHGKSAMHRGFAAIYADQGKKDLSAYGLVIQFSNRVYADSIDEHVFQVLMKSTLPNGASVWINLPGKIQAVNNITIDNYSLIQDATEIKGQMAKGVAFIPLPFAETGGLTAVKAVTAATDAKNNLLNLWVRLLGDFVKDARVKDHIGPAIDTGYHLKEGRRGVQGGVFESWLEATAPSKTFLSPVAVNANNEDEKKLRTVPGIGPATLQRIIAARSTQPFTSVEQVLQLIPARFREEARKLITVTPVG